MAKRIKNAYLHAWRAFVKVNGITHNGTVRLKANSKLDTSFNLGTGVGGQVLATVIQPDGKIVIGGGFSTFNSSTRGSISRLNADGSLNASFGTSVTNYVNVLVLQADGKIIAGGRS